MDRLLERDATLKLLSLLLAVILWYQVFTDQTAGATMQVADVPVQIANIPAGLVVLAQEPQVVSIGIRGAARAVGGLSAKDLKASVDLGGAGAGRAKYPLHVSVPKGVQFVEVSPPQVTVTLDVLMDAQVSVEVLVRGRLGEDFAATAAQVRPTDVVVEGPRTRAQIVDRCVAELDISGAQGLVTRAVALRAVDARGQEVAGITIRPATVDVSVPVVALPPSKLVPVTVAVRGAPEPGFYAGDPILNPHAVRVRGPLAVLAQITELSAGTIDITGARTNVTQTFTLGRPEGALSIEPDRLTATVPITLPGLTKTFNNMRVYVEGVPEGHTAQVIPAAVDITVWGPRELVWGLTTEQVFAYVAVNQGSSGQFTLEVFVRVPEGVQVPVVTPSAVTVILKRI